jgi:hypothetical protein
VTVRALTCTGSDHTPLLIDSGDQAHIRNKAHFSFELSWFRQDGFYDLVKNEWLSVPNGGNPVENWQNKVRHLRRFLRGWAKNMSSFYKTEKVRLTTIIENLDLKAENIMLTNDERVCLRNANDELAKLRRDEETKWAQRAKVKHVQDGGITPNIFILWLMVNIEKREYFS